MREMGMERSGMIRIVEMARGMLERKMWKM